ncbi:MAG: ABC transporter substrate-binding protein [Cryobacterium sp.]|nr:ABC transporter substrate-binding protein [Cryobacterium sp.]
MRRILSLLIAAMLAVGIAACAGVQASPDPAAIPTPEPADGCSLATEHLANARLIDLPLVDSVRQATGPSTACLPGHAIARVSDVTAPVLPVSVIDAEGRPVTVTDVSRILPIDISGTIAATVFALGLGDNVVGRDTSTDFEGTETLPVVTKSGHTLNAEAILQLAPTVVLTDTSIGPKEVRQQLRDAGITVVVISSERRLDTTDELVDEISTALGVPTRGDALNERVRVELDEVASEVAAVTPKNPEDRARMLFLYVRGNANIYYIFGRDTGADSLIESVGGIDVASEIGWEGAKPMTAEALVAAQPDVIVMMTKGLESMGGVDGLLEKLPAVAQTPAGANRRIIDMEDSHVLSFGPRTAEIVRALARALYAPAAAGASE